MKSIPLDFELNIQKAEETDSGKWIVEGLAATTDFDLQNDIISQKAIDESAKDLLTNSTVLFNHDSDKTIGKVLESKSVRGGLWIKVFISKTMPDLWEQIKEGVISKFSIRGKIIDAKKKWVESIKKWVQIIIKMKLAEVSLVSVPANPQAKALRWYVQKSLQGYYNQGNDLEILKEGGTTMDFNIEDCLDEILPVGDVSKGNSDNKEVAKGDVLDEINALIRATKDPALKDKLQQIKDMLMEAKGKKGKGKDKDKYPYPEPKAKSADDETDYAELDQETDPDIKALIMEAIAKAGEDGGDEDDADQDDESTGENQEEESADAGVEKGGKAISRKSETRLSSIMSMLNEAITKIKELIGKTEDDEKAKKILESFESIKALIDDKSDEGKQDNLDAFEKMAEIQAGIIKQSQSTEKKVEVITDMLAKLFKGVGAVRNKDGTISVGQEAVKGLDQRKDDRQETDESSVETMKSSERYQKSDIQGKREMLTNAIGAILAKRNQE